MLYILFICTYLSEHMFALQLYCFPYTTIVLDLLVFQVGWCNTLIFAPKISHHLISSIHQDHALGFGVSDQGVQVMVLRLWLWFCSGQGLVLKSLFFIVVNYNLRSRHPQASVGMIKASLVS
ncbi:unnamed protein product [Vicia faba]|uniref:Uncharacterized protein n=1 Tax=Vicia faba TaxID=3906 RepID=A0AAV0YUF1_VICFA|nr:unnamed protein product [Vicia faba]